MMDNPFEPPSSDFGHVADDKPKSKDAPGCMLAIFVAALLALLVLSSWGPAPRATHLFQDINAHVESVPAE